MSLGFVHYMQRWPRRCSKSWWKMSSHFLNLFLYLHSWVPLHSLIYLLLSVLFSLLGVSRPHYLPSGCSSFHLSPSRFPLENSSHLFLLSCSLHPSFLNATLRVRSAVTTVSRPPPHPPGVPPPATSLIYLCITKIWHSASHVVNLMWTFIKYMKEWINEINLTMVSTIWIKGKGAKGNGIRC